MAQVVELLPSKYEALSSNPSEKKKKEGKRKGRKVRGEGRGGKVCGIICHQTAGLN
jgi:hypothetical protein